MCIGYFPGKKKLNAWKRVFFRFAKSSICICTYEMFHVSPRTKAVSSSPRKKAVSAEIVLFFSLFIITISLLIKYCCFLPVYRHTCRKFIIKKKKKHKEPGPGKSLCHKSWSLLKCRSLDVYRTVAHLFISFCLKAFIAKAITSLEYLSSTKCTNYLRIWQPDYDIRLSFYVDICFCLLTQNIISMYMYITKTKKMFFFCIPPPPLLQNVFALMLPLFLQEELVRWCWQFLGRSIRVPFPSCAMTKIREALPSYAYCGFRQCCSRVHPTRVRVQGRFLASESQVFYIRVPVPIWTF